MIIIKLTGGLGNQMFQYACARAIAHRNNCQVLADLSFYNEAGQTEGTTVRDFLLGNFSFALDVANTKLIKLFTQKQKSIFQRIFGNTKNYNFVCEEAIYYKPYITELKAPLLLHGYFQSEKYFKDAEHLIRADFKFKSSSSRNNQLLEKIKSTNSVSLHIRRGDYATNANINQYHGLCSLNFYKEAIKIIEERVDNPHFYIFSDDLEWTKQNLPINHPHTFVEGNIGKASFEDMRLMSFCKHNITANSSFSWWGAWLNENLDKIVVAPKNWVTTNTYSIEDLLPPSWIKINSLD
jgi:hypothetical protein